MKPHFLTLSAPQHTFLYELNTKFKAYVGGYGSGKTFIGCIEMLLFAEAHPNSLQAYYAPTYNDISSIFYPTIEVVAEMFGLTIDIVPSKNTISLYREGTQIGTIWCRNMEDPNRIKGISCAHVLIDEIDTMPQHKAKMAWEKIIARLRQNIDGLEPTVSVVTTPEGFGFIYERFKKNPTKMYSMVQASTYENIYLPETYIPSLYDSYAAELVKAYLYGEFVNLTSGTVYLHFDQHLNHQTYQIQPGEPLDIGMDFNVGNRMCAIIYRRASKQQPLHIIGELTGYADTPAMCKALHEHYPNHDINIYPDASGNSRKSTDSSTTDHQILRDAGFRVLSKGKNPFVRDRIRSVNRMFEHRTLTIDTEKCPRLTEALQQQIYTPNGEPDKNSGLDDILDAMGYRVAYDHMVSRPRVAIGHQGGSTFKMMH